jgi:hypothetical protein
MFDYAKKAFLAQARQKSPDTTPPSESLTGTVLIP